MLKRTWHVAFAGICLAVLLATPGRLSAGHAVGAATGTSMEGLILWDLNRDRVSLGLRGLRVDARLTSVARNRAAWMASAGEMSHDTWGGLPWDAIDAVNLAVYSSGEAVGQTSAAWGDEAAEFLYGLWRDSPPHWELMTSDSFNYIGIGVAYRAESGETFSSLVFAEAPDSSRPIAEMTAASAVGSTITFGWTGRDGLLQSHTAGLKDYDVQYRVDDGSWTMLKAHTTLTRLVLTGRATGHTYSVRVRDRDRRNNLSAWSAPRTVNVP